MKKIFALLLTLSSVLLVNAQREEYQVSSTKDSSATRAEHPVGWIRAHILDNWMGDLMLGTNLYYGYEDTKGPFGDRLGYDFEMHIGRWVFPMLGLRAGFGYSGVRGFITTDSYLQNRETLTSNFGECEGNSTTSVNINGTDMQGALGGYYWTYEDDPSLLIQRWKYFYFGGDFMVNLTNFKPIRFVKDRRISNIAYLGFHVRIGLSEANPEMANSNFFGYAKGIGFHNTNFSPEGHIGYIMRYRLTDHFHIAGDIRLSLAEGTTDRERLPRVEKFAPDLHLHLALGLFYEFNLRSDEARRVDFLERHIISNPTDKLPTFAAFVQVEEQKVYTISDTIWSIMTEVIDDSVILAYRDSMIYILDSMVEATTRIPDSTSFDEILRKNLLPYEMVFFDLDKWIIKPSEELKIAKMARLMKSYPNHLFILYGSADSKTGTRDHNMMLSINRADVVYRKLTEKYGVPKGQLKCEYLGGILSFDPFILNRTTVIIMDHPAVHRAFEQIKAQRKAGGGVIEL